MIVIERRLADECVPVDAADEHRHLDRVVDHRRAGAEAVPRLVELGREGPVLVEVARLDRQVGRLQGPAALLVEDVDGSDEPHVVDEVGEVARPPAAVEVAHERRPADRAEDQVRAAEEHVALGVPGVQPELARGRRHQRLHLRRIEADHPRRPIHLRSGPRERVERPVAEDLHPDLGEDAQRRHVDRLDLVRRQDLDRAIRVDQAPPRELADPGRGAPRSTPGGVGLGHRSCAADATRRSRPFSRPSQRPRLPWRSQVTPQCGTDRRRLGLGKGST